MTERDIIWFEDLRCTDVGAMEGSGIAVPEGFATTAAAYRNFLATAGIEAAIGKRIAAFRAGKSPLALTAQQIRRLIQKARLPAPLSQAIVAAYAELFRRTGKAQAAVAEQARFVLTDAEVLQLARWAVLVTRSTDPDWLPAMRRAAGIVTDHGGPASHAAIVA